MVRETSRRERAGVRGEGVDLGGEGFTAVRDVRGAVGVPVVREHPRRRRGDGERGERDDRCAGDDARARVRVARDGVFDERENVSGERAADDEDGFRGARRRHRAGGWEGADVRDDVV